MKKKIFGYLFCILGLMLPLDGFASFSEIPSEFTGPTWYDYRDQNFSIEGKGSLENPIVVSTAEELAQLAYLFNENSSQFKNKIVVLGADINLNKTVDGKRVQWIPIGYDGAVNYLTFLGVDIRNNVADNLASAQRHTISGMYINIDMANSQHQSNLHAWYPKIGFFSGLDNSFIGYVNIDDAEVTVIDSNVESIHHCRTGILVGEHTGRLDYLDYPTISDGENTVILPGVIDGVSVNGTLNVTGRGHSDYHDYVGGIVGDEQSDGITHSTFNGTINVTNATYVGGIAGYNVSDIIDCSANANITSNSNSNNVPHIGGIIGHGKDSYFELLQARRIEACVSMGSIKCSKENQQRHVVGGICGYLGQHITMLGCSSTMFIYSYGYVGGLAGWMQKIEGEGIGPDGTYNYRDSKIECCSFGGHIDGTIAHIDDNGQILSTDISSVPNNYVGGLCGYLEWSDNHEHITRCLFVGTMMNIGDNYDIGNRSVTVGHGENYESTVTYCYYDNNMYTRNVYPDNGENATIFGVPTKDLISGTDANIANLNFNESEPYGFKLVSGSYPIPYSNNTSKTCQTVFGRNNSAALSDLAKRMFYWNNMNTQNSVYLAGTNLCAQPVQFGDGDAADNFIAEFTVPTKTTIWKEAGTNRDISFTTECLLPDVDCISVNDKTATAYQTGNCIFTIEGTSKIKTTSSTTAYDRPTPIGGTKTLGLRVESQSAWSGDEADTFAGGSGEPNDPYLIKNGEQLIHAIKHNTEGKFYKQICDITITKKVGENTLVTKNTLEDSTLPTGIIGSNHWDTHNCEWKATYDGNGHVVKGLYLMNYNGLNDIKLSLFGNIGKFGTVKNLGVIDTWIDNIDTEGKNISFGMIASEVSGDIINCLTQGVDASGKPCGGICTYVKLGGKVEDCISAVFSISKTQDIATPFVAYSNTENTGTVSNCLAVAPVRLTSDRSMTDMNCIKDCYWLKGYEAANTGNTLDEIGNALSKRSLWTWEKAFFPMLKTFRNKEIGMLMKTPVRTDEADTYLMGFTKMLEFESGTAIWMNIYGTDYVEADSDLGIVAPTNVMPSTYTVYNILKPVEYICASLGKTFYYIPMMTNSTNVEKGITFVDHNAELACIAAFDEDGDNRLSLAELSAVTTEQTLSAFNNDIGKEIVKFPEFRFFKKVSTLTTQLNGLSKLEEVRLPYGLTTIGGKDGDEYITPFDGCTSLTEMTIPVNVTTVEPGAFYKSSVNNILVDTLNTKFVTREGILFNKNDELVSYPNGRIGEEIVLPGVIEAILEGSVYRIGGLRRVYFDTTDYETVADLEDDGIVSDNGELIDVYISDATYGSVLYNKYLDDDSWDDYASADKLHCYYPLKIGSAKAGTMYIGFDTELPSGLNAYIVTSDDIDEHLAYLKKMSNKIPNRSPIVVFADEPGTYRLFPLAEVLEDWKMYNNQLNGVGRDGMEVYQSDSDRGSILTLGRNSEGTLGFFYYKGTAPIPPYRAYLTYEWVTDANQYLLFSIVDDDPTGITQHITPNTQQQDWYTLDGRRINGQPTTRGIYIRGGKKYVVK